MLLRLGLIAERHTLWRFYQIRYLSQHLSIFSSKNSPLIIQRCLLSAQSGSQKSTVDDKDKSSEVTKHGEYKSVLEEILLKKPKKPVTMAEKVKEKAENTFLYAVLVASVGALGVLCYFLFEQFFSMDSPQKIFSDALSLIRADENCEELFGKPIAGFGEETSRGRRRHVAHQKYQKDGRERIRVVFHLKGPKCQGLAQAEMEQLDGNWEWRFLLVQTRERPSRTHVLIDNRV